MSTVYLLLIVSQYTDPKADYSAEKRLHINTIRNLLLIVNEFSVLKLTGYKDIVRSTAVITDQLALWKVGEPNNSLEDGGPCARHVLVV
jgi:hypothetical protein